VYCLWDQTKSTEGDDVGAVVDDRTFAEYGPFFDGARSLMNGSFGEPLLHPRFREIVEFTASHEKVLEVSSNGQAFTPETVAALAGKPVHLYVSLDAGSPGTYARLRNDRWHEIITGLTFLREARRRSHGTPKLYVVFMPMRANLGDIEAVVRLCRMVEADQLVLRPLNLVEDAVIVGDRGGYHFDYAAELLSLDEHRAVAARCAAVAARVGVRVVNQLEFGLEQGGHGQ
jgi:MoaA/NifB/PqqE/SkfB family radical SAM enzyme